MYMLIHVHLFLQGELDELQSLAPDIADRLITRSNDKATVVENEIGYYKQHMLRHIEVCTVHIILHTVHVHVLYVYFIAYFH